MATHTVTCEYCCAGRRSSCADQLVWLLADIVFTKVVAMVEMLLEHGWMLEIDHAYHGRGSTASGVMHSPRGDVTSSSSTVWAGCALWVWVLACCSKWNLGLPAWSFRYSLFGDGVVADGWGRRRLIAMHMQHVAAEHCPLCSCSWLCCLIRGGELALRDVGIRS